MELFHDNSLLRNYFCKKCPIVDVRLSSKYASGKCTRWIISQNRTEISYKSCSQDIIFDDLIRKWYFENFLSTAIFRLQFFFISVVILVRYFYSMWITCTYIKNFSLIDETQNNFFSIPQLQKNQKTYNWFKVLD